MINHERSNVPLFEEFSEREWTYYDSFETITKEHLAFQKHVDLRTFVQTSGEQWTEGTYGAIDAHDHFPGLSLFVRGTTESESATPNHPVDLLTGFVDTDILTFALPNFSLNVVNLNQSNIQITSDPEGHCSNTKLTATISFQESSTALIEGNTQFSIPRGALQQNEIDLKSITGVRFKIVCNAGEEGPLIFMGLKLILVSHGGNPGWAISNVDFDNWNGILRRPNALNGEVPPIPEFNQGILWRSEVLPGYNDPMPVDTEFGIVFNTGSQEKINEVTFYAREEPLIFQTQLDLIGVTQGQLDGHGQPDLGSEEYSPRLVGELDEQTMERLEHLETMAHLERIPVENPVEQSWVYFTLRWGEGKTKMIMSNSSATGYIFPSGHEHPFFANLEPYTEYLMTCFLEDSGARVRIYELNLDKSVAQTPIFDSTLVEDDGIFRRRQGRIGWSAVLNDADAYLNSIRPRSVVFAEYKSVPFTSFTPVDGAQLFASFTGNEELWNKGFTVIPEESEAVLLTRDKSRTLSGESFRIDVNGTTRDVGISTGPIEFTNFNQAEIRFFIWFSGEPRSVERIEVKRPPTLPGKRRFPSGEAYEPHDPLIGGMYPSSGYTEITETPVSNIIARLVSEEGTIINLPMPELETNQWQEIVLRVPINTIIQTGKYNVQIIQPTLIASTWWVDNISIFERVVQWSARSVVSDPWNSNYAPWTDFRELVNENRKGILLTPRGKELQMRARALRQNATIKSPKIIPRYASLGRLVWPEEQLLGLVDPKAGFKAKEFEEKIWKFTDESNSEVSEAKAKAKIFIGDESFELKNEKTISELEKMSGTIYVSGTGIPPETFITFISQLISPPHITDFIHLSQKITMTGEPEITFEGRVMIDEATPIVSREWNFGDGSFIAGNRVAVEHTYTQPGNYYVTLIVMDRHGLRNQFTEEILIS